MSLTTVQQGMIGTQSSIPMTYGNLGAGDASIMKNRIINGAMVINQRALGTTSVQTSTTYVSCDRWSVSASQNSKYTIQQSSTAPTGFNNSILLTSSAATSLAAGDYFALSQGIEGYNMADFGWGTSSAKTVTLSFWVQSSLTGTFGGSLTNNAGTRSYPFTYTISSANTWTQASITIAGETTGTWNITNGAGIYLYISIGMGSTYSGTAGAWANANYDSATGATSVVGTSGATFYITGVQLEVGSSATGYEYVNYQTSLANCQRYYQQIGSGMFIGSSSTTSVVGAIPFFTQMRATPTASLSGVMNVTDNSANYTQSSATINTNYMQSNGGALDLGGFSGITGFRPYWYASANSSNRFFNFSAEL